LEVISAGFRRVNAVPAPGLPLPALLVLALITAGAATRRAQRRAG
jgi:hypothetical protein